MVSKQKLLHQFEKKKKIYEYLKTLQHRLRAFSVHCWTFIKKKNCLIHNNIIYVVIVVVMILKIITSTIALQNLHTSYIKKIILLNILKNQLFNIYLLVSTYSEQNLILRSVHWVWLWKISLKNTAC